MAKLRKNRYRHHVMIAFFSVMAGAAAPYSEPTVGRGFKNISTAPISPQGRVSPEEAMLRPVIVDPGHGGIDLGARVHGVNEKDISFSIARKLQKILIHQGAVPAMLTRDTDIFVPLDERVTKTIRWRGQAVISVHVDQIQYRRLHGITIYSYGKSHGRPRPRRTRLQPIPPPPKEAARAGAELARALSRSLRSAGFDVEGTDKEDYYILKNPQIPSVLIEVGYLSNPQEAKKLVDPAYQERLAEAISRGLDSYRAKSKHPYSPASLAKKP